MRSYAIGDIHGHLDKLLEAHRLVEEDRARTGDAEAPLIHLGDLVDRGPESRGVICHLMTGIAGGAPWVVLKGNHDRMMAMFMQDAPMRDPRLRGDYSWLHPNLGGLSTLASYGVGADLLTPPDEVHAEALARVPSTHVAFLTALPVSFRRGPCLFVHAGIRPGVALDRQDETDLLWIRDEFHKDRRDHGALIVHGHTPVDAATHYGNRVNLDSGAAFGGPLSAAVFDEGGVFLLTEDGRQPLLPG